MFIHNASTYVTAPADVKTLKEELRRHTDTYFRRISKFVVLALIGACSCAARNRLERETAIYLTTENGNLADTESVLSQIYRRHSLPLPFNFINTMANTASFYIAQGLGLCGRNISVSSQNLSFERGLELLKTDMELRFVRHALIGLVDEATASAPQFEASSGVSNAQINQIDRSCWLYVTSEREGAIGEVTAIRSFKGQNDAMNWLERNPAVFSADTVISFGAAMGPVEKDMWLTRVAAITSRPAMEFDYVSNSGNFNVTTACGVAAFITNKLRFLNTSDASQMLHINKNFSDQYVILQVSRR
jgi:hypothetical protein